jgi:tetratricopeptide (TPR) repeat protein
MSAPKKVARNTMRDCVFKTKLTGPYEVENALNEMRIGIQYDPDSLVLQNAYRMTLFRLRLNYLKEARARGELTPKFPPHLDRQPIAFFEELLREHAARETKLQMALAWVDEMLLFPALEIKAPSSVQAVDILTQILEEPGNENYVPALFARGLNHLHRPARLVWPETNKTPPDAAVKDIAKCVAIGRKLNLGSARLQATLAMTLGDAYVKAGRLSVARSWWQIAQNLFHEDDIQQAVRRRYAWGDEEILDRLEEELDRARMELDRPMTDLALMWN